MRSPIKKKIEVVRESEFEESVAKELKRLRISEEARRQLSAEKAGQRFAFPEFGYTLADELEEPIPECRWTVDRLHPHGGNSLLVAQHKTGKTTLLMNLARSLADETPFVGGFDVRSIEGRVGFLNFELPRDQFRTWTRDLRIEHPDRIVIAHLRGRIAPIWDSEYAHLITEWLKRNEVELLIVDPAAAAWRGLVTSEIDNVQIGDFTGALDEIKEAAGIPDLVLATHTGRAHLDEGQERSRGGTRLEDWMDAGWYLTSDRSEQQLRSLRANGRDVDMEAVDLRYDPGSRRLCLTGQTRKERREESGVQAAVEALARIEHSASEPPTTNALTDEIRGDKNLKNKWIAAAEKQGLIKRVRGSGNALLCHLTDTGRTLAGLEKIRPISRRNKKRSRPR